MLILNTQNRTIRINQKTYFVYLYLSKEIVIQQHQLRLHDSDDIIFLFIFKSHGMIIIIQKQCKNLSLFKTGDLFKAVELLSIVVDDTLLP